MNDLKAKIQAYTSPWWNNKEIEIITGLGSVEASKIKQQVIKNGGCVPGHGQKVYRDFVCKMLNINIKQEIELLTLAAEATKAVSS